MNNASFFICPWNQILPKDLLPLAVYAITDGFMAERPLLR